MAIIHALIAHTRLSEKNSWSISTLLFTTEQDGNATIRCKNITEKFNPLSRVHQSYRRQTDDRRNSNTTRIAESNVLTFG